VATIAWPWYVLIGLTITFVTGMLSSFTHAAPAHPAGGSPASRSV